MPKIKLIVIEAGDRVLVQDSTMDSPQEAEVVRVLKRNADVRFSDGKIKHIHRKFILSKEVF